MIALTIARTGVNVLSSCYIKICASSRLGLPLAYSDCLLRASALALSTPFRYLTRKFRDVLRLQRNLHCRTSRECHVRDHQAWRGQDCDHCIPTCRVIIRDRMFAHCDQGDHCDQVTERLVYRNGSFLSR